MCYTDNCSCKLVCGHSFCHSCVKEWYTTSETPSCPMCRQDMYFRGMHKAKAKWQEEADEKHLATVYAQVFENALDDEDSMELIEEVDYNFHRLKHLLLDYDVEQAVEIVECYFGPSTAGKVMSWPDWGNLPQRRCVMVSKYPQFKLKNRAKTLVR